MNSMFRIATAALAATLVGTPATLAHTADRSIDFLARVYLAVKQYEAKHDTLPSRVDELQLGDDAPLDRCLVAVDTDSALGWHGLTEGGKLTDPEILAKMFAAADVEPFLRDDVFQFVTLCLADGGKVEVWSIDEQGTPRHRGAVALPIAAKQAEPETRRGAAAAPRGNDVKVKATHATHKSGAPVIIKDLYGIWRSAESIKGERKEFSFWGRLQNVLGEPLHIGCRSRLVVHIKGKKKPHVIEYGAAQYRCGAESDLGVGESIQFAQEGFSNGWNHRALEPAILQYGITKIDWELVFFASTPLGQDFEWVAVKAVLPPHTTIGKFSLMGTSP